MELLFFILILPAGVFLLYLIDRLTSFLEPVFQLVFLCLFVLLMVAIVVLIVLWIFKGIWVVIEPFAPVF